MSFGGFFSGKSRGTFAIIKRRRRADALAAAVESLERRFMLSAVTAPASWQAYTPLVVVNAGAGLSAPFTAPQIRQAYGINQVSDEGSGQTIAIIDAYNDPDILSDANTFSGTYGLQTFNTSGGPTLTVENEYGSTTNLPANSQLNAPDGQQWDVEESLDVEWAHTIAPMANVILLEADSSSFQDLFTAISTAADTPGVSTVSMSFSGGEFDGEQSFDSTFTTPAGHSGVTFVAATGDSSFPGGYPAVSQNVLAVGGTSLAINSDGSYGGETAWSGSGGNISDYETQPVYQNLDASRYSLTQRTSPDVSWLADPNTGVEVLDSYDGGWLQIGGTSLATPMWAALISIADQSRNAGGLSSLDTAQTHALLYSLPESDFNDITSGNNGYPAITGYDIATGLGSPNVPALVSGLSGDNAIFVDAGSPGAVQNGSSWTDAFTSLQTALGAAAPGTTILAAQGTFTPTSGTDQTASFQLANGVTLLGGFSGYGTSNPDASGAGFTTALSGDIGVAGNNSDNSFHVVTGSGTNSSAILDGFTISGGNADGSGANQLEGAGLLDISGSPTISDCSFVNNSAGLDGAGGYGGGVYDSSSTATLDDCTFSGDSADGVGGGGMFNLSSTPTLTDCTFTDNLAGSGVNSAGGAIFNDLSSGILSNCLFNGNMSDNGGGAVYNSGSSPTLTNCTLTANAANGVFGYGGAMDNSAFCSPKLVNCIVWDNVATLVGGIYDDTTSTATITCSDIQSGFTGTGNINADPIFVNAAQNDFQLQETSPCIDAGSNAGVPASLTTDLTGFSRIAGTTVDMGAFESQMLYVDAGATGGGSGGSWRNAFTSLATAMTFVQWGQTIDVAGGTYTPGPGTNPAATFSLLDNVALYGGYAGSASSNPFTRNVAQYPSILSGVIGAGENSYHVVSILTNVSPTAILDGFTITGGNANAGGDGNSSLGAGIFEIDGSPAINDCIITGNEANGLATTADGENSDGFGAGMLDFEGSPTISNCTFSGNTTTGQYAYGAAILDEFASPIFLNCNFSNNTDNGQNNYGAAIFSYMSSETLTGCAFANNLANNPGYGGAIADDDSSPILTNCVFNSNSADGSDPFEAGWGGAMINFSSSLPVLTNCTFSDNFADLAGAVANFTDSNSTLTNCIAYGDSDFFGYEVFVNGDGSAATITYSDIEGGFTGTGNINADPLFTDAAAGNLTLQPASPCINTGNNAAIQATGVTTDIAGSQRIQGGTVDMGAYEAAFGPVTWTGGGDGIDWSDPNNWSNQEVPTQNTSVTIPAGVAVVEIGGGAFSAGAINSSSPLEILAGGSLQLFGNAVETGTLTIDSGGTLDIQNHSLTINFGSSANDPLATIQGYLQTGYNNDTWTGTGIISSNAAANPGLYAVGYADGNDDVGTPAAANQIFIQNTLAGDANLDTLVNFSDLLAVAQDYGRSGQDWAHGDFNYDGLVNFSDLLLVAQNYGKQLAAGQLAQSPGSFAASAPTSATTPATAATLDLSAPAADRPMNPFPLSIAESAPPVVIPSPQSAATPSTEPPPAAITNPPAANAPAAAASSATSSVTLVSIPAPASNPPAVPAASLAISHKPKAAQTHHSRHNHRGPAAAPPTIAVPIAPTASVQPRIMEDGIVSVWSGIASPDGDGLFSDTMILGKKGSRTDAH